MYREDDWADPPVDGWSGLIVLVPYIGGIIWLAKLQSALNGFWEQTMPGTARPF
jgi:hypothetical protein